MLMKSRKFLTGRVKWASVDRVESVLRGVYPRAMSQFRIRVSTNLNQSSVPKVLDYLLVKGDVELVETTENRKFWRWVKRSGA